LQFAFVYTREAHPGERWPHHAKFEDKLDHARQMVEKWDIRRPMLVDALEGPVHRAYGLLPNMAYLVNRLGRVVYRANWTDATSVEIACAQVVREKEAKRARQRLAPFTVEWQPQRINERDPFMEGLAENGPKAVDEFIDAIRGVHGDKAVRDLVDWRDARKS